MPPIPSQIPTPLSSLSMIPPPPIQSYQQMGGTSLPPTQMYAPTALAQTGIEASHSFCVPFTYIPGPNRDDILLATKGSAEKWVHPEGSSLVRHPFELPIHQTNIKALEDLCAKVSASDEKCECSVRVIQQDLVKGTFTRRKQRDFVTTVYISGSNETAVFVRGLILKSVPVALKSDFIDLEASTFFKNKDGQVTESPDPAISTHLNWIAEYTGADIFVLRAHGDPTMKGFDPQSDCSQTRRVKIAIFGTVDVVEHAKTRVLILIDRLLDQLVESVQVDLSLHPLVCGRSRRILKNIESKTGTAIYFPPLFPGIYGYSPPGVHTRDPNQIFITGKNQQQIRDAQSSLIGQARRLPIFVKQVTLADFKADYLILERLDDIRKIMAEHGTFVQFPALGQLPQAGSRRSYMVVQGTEAVYVERTVKAIMTLCGQFYIAVWWLLGEPAPNALMPSPSANEVRDVMTDIAAYSGAEVSFSKHSFMFYGLDDDVKIALEQMNKIAFANCTPHQIRCKIELAVEHKEFVSGKKNGKINKIMGNSNVQIMFENFNEYDFFIDVSATKYDCAINGLALVEQELPASVSFHVPDVYHKRIIGMGGQHIQRIMKKYSVFVKFTNAMELSHGDKDLNDMSKVDNVICRTPARNAANLEMVKGEIMDMVATADAEIVQESVSIPRLLHRSLAAQHKKIGELEREWGITITFPSTEMASDIVTIRGPEWQLPYAIEAFLDLVPETHKVTIKDSPELRKLVTTDEYDNDITVKCEKQFGILIQVGADQDSQPQSENDDTIDVVFKYSRSKAGSLLDAIDYFAAYLQKHGIKSGWVKGLPPRPQSDSFEEAFPHFASLLIAPVSRSGSPGSKPRNRLSNGSLTSCDGSEFNDQVKEAFTNGDNLNGITSMRKASNSSLSSASVSSHVSGLACASAQLNSKPVVSSQNQPHSNHVSNGSIDDHHHRAPHQLSQSQSQSHISAHQPSHTAHHPHQSHQPSHHPSLSLQMPQQASHPQTPQHNQTPFGYMAANGSRFFSGSVSAISAISNPFSNECFATGLLRTSNLSNEPSTPLTPITPGSAGFPQIPIGGHGGHGHSSNSSAGNVHIQGFSNGPGSISGGPVIPSRMSSLNYQHY